MGEPTHLIDADQLSKQADLQQEATIDLTRPHQPDAQPQQDNPEPDLGSGVGDPGAAAGALGGTPGAPAAPTPPKPPSIGDKINSFITGGQQSPGQMWRGVIAGALQGMAAGAGTGHLGTGAAAGAEAQQKAAAVQAQAKQQGIENQRNQSKDEIESSFKRAQIAQMNHDIFTTGQELKLKQLQASDQHAELGNTMQREILAAPGSKDLGVVHDADDLVALHQANPDLPKDMARGNIMSMPNYEQVRDKDGNPTGEVKYNGTHAYYVAPDYQKQKIDHDINVPIFTPGKAPGEAGTWGTQTVKAGTVSNQEALSMMQSQGNTAAKYDNDTAVAKANLMAAQAQAALAKTAVNAQAAAEMKQNVQNAGIDLVERNNDPSLLNKRAKDYDAKLAAARAYSLEKYGKVYDIDKAVSDYKFATNTGTQNRMKYFNALTGSDNQGGMLTRLAQQSDALKRTQLPALNDAAAWAREAAGDSQIATYRLDLKETMDMLANALQGGTGSGSTNAKMEQALSMVKEDFNPKTLRATVDEVRFALANRKKEVIGDNGYLQKWYGAQGAGAPGQGGGGAAQPPGGGQGGGQGGGTTNDPFNKFGGAAHKQPN